MAHAECVGEGHEVAHQSFHGRFGHIACASPHLHRTARDALARFRGEGFCQKTPPGVCDPSSCSTAQAAAWRLLLAASSSIRLSQSMKPTVWCSTIGFPPCTRSRAWSSACSWDFLAVPTTAAAGRMRVACAASRHVLLRAIEGQAGFYVFEAQVDILAGAHAHRVMVMGDRDSAALPVFQQKNPTLVLIRARPDSSR